MIYRYFDFWNSNETKTIFVWKLYHDFLPEVKRLEF